MKKITLALLLTIVLLTACGKSSMNHGDMNGPEQSSHPMDSGTVSQHPVDSSMGAPMDHSSHSSSGELPKGLKAAENPTYKVGNKAINKADHMAGMQGATATIAGAFDTTAYAVSYTPTTGGERVTNHKWVVHEEIKNAGSETLKPGTEVTLEADHMPGMKDAVAKIDSAEHTTVYMIDYTPTTGGEKVTNHKWVTESELSAAK